MRYTLTILEDHYKQLHEAIFSKKGCEGAAYLLCGRSQTNDEERLLCREVVPVREEHYLIREPYRLSIDSLSYTSIAKRAKASGDSVIFVHSHPGGIENFSGQDNREEPKLMTFLQDRGISALCGSLVVTDKPTLTGRVWGQGGWVSMKRVRVIGRRFSFYGESGDSGTPIPSFFDRQVRAFGEESQRLLSRLHIGVVGAGGTGSSVIEQLVRLGVGTLSIFDGDTFDPSNTNRVYGSTSKDKDKNKAELASSHSVRMELGTKVRTFSEHITAEETAKAMRGCDIIFGCTDKHTPRGILVQLSLRYLIPVIDMGVKINSEGGIIREIIGRVTTLLPGEACLFCRGRISPDVMRAESLSVEERRALAEEGYAPELEINNPAVIAFTTAVGAQAISEFLHRLTGFMGEERASSEVLMFFHDTELKRNRTDPGAECICSQRRLWGRGDTNGSFLDLAWTK